MLFAEKIAIAIVLTVVLITRPIKRRPKRSGEEVTLASKYSGTAFVLLAL
jgi:hypothetical protein